MSEHKLPKMSSSGGDFLSLVRHSAVYGVARMALSGIDLVFLPVYARVLSPSEYGLVAVGTSLLAVFSILYTFGLDGAFGRLFFTAPDESDEQRSVFGGILVGMLAVGLPVSGALIAAGPARFGVLLRGVSERFFVLLVLIALFNLLPLLWLQLLQVRRRPVEYLLTSVAFAFGRSVSTIGAVVLMHRGADGWAEAYLATALIASAAATVFLRPYLRFSNTASVLRSALPFSLPLFVHQAAAWLAGSAGRLLLNALVPLAAVGTYQVAYSLGQGVSLITTAVNFAYAPAFMAAAERSPEEASVDFGRFATIYLKMLFFLAVLVALFRVPIVRLVATPELVAAAPILPIVLATFVTQGIYFVLVNPIFFHKASVRVLPFLTIGGAVIGLSGLALMVPRIGVAGAAWASLVANVAVTVIAYPLSQRSLRLAYDLTGLGLVGVAGIAIILGSYLLSSCMAGPSGELLLSSILAASYTAFVAKVMGISPSRVLAALRAQESS